MDLTSDLHKRVYQRVDAMIGTEDTQLNGAVKAALLSDEMTQETREQVELKLSYNNWLIQQVAKQEMTLTFDAAGNVIEIPADFREIEPIDASGDEISNVVLPQN